MIAWGATDLATRLKLKMVLQTIPAISLLLILAWVTHRQIGYWSSSYNFWARTLAVTRNNLIALHNMGLTLDTMGSPDEAIEQYKAEAELNPHGMLIQFLIGQYLYSHRKLPEALAQFNKMTTPTNELQPLAAAYAGMGMVYSDMRDKN
jgi:tetratricopeptide (TPR) repeat protein